MVLQRIKAGFVGEGCSSGCSMGRGRSWKDIKENPAYTLIPGQNKTSSEKCRIKKIEQLQRSQETRKFKEKLITMRRNVLTDGRDVIERWKQHYVEHLNDMQHGGCRNPTSCNIKGLNFPSTSSRARKRQVWMLLEQKTKYMLYRRNQVRQGLLGKQCYETWE